MKIAVTSTGPTLEYYVGTEVNHCPYLLIIDPDTMWYEAMQNPAISLKGLQRRNYLLNCFRKVVLKRF